VSRPAYETAHLEDLPRFSGEFDTIPIRIPLGIEAFGVNAYGTSSRSTTSSGPGPGGTRSSTWC
jgi:hypothetical protein